ncbi:MAG TPA: response regulator, partial [Candidatus Saccharimonadales bacterium]|nr:response regulator [Candidatus Saccharimonadales bacterium]
LLDEKDLSPYLFGAIGKLTGLLCMNRNLSVLLIEDSEPDALLIRRQLESAGYRLTVKRVQTASELQSALAKQNWDLFVSDYRLPQFSGLDALKLIQRHGSDQPFILVSGYIGEETAVAAMKAGAHDYVMKENLARLVPAVERELKEAGVRQARAKGQAELEKSNRELGQARAKLEERVRERTAELIEANDALRAQIEQRKRLEAELLESVERERRRIGIDLHDELGQLMNGLALRLKSLELRLESRKADEVEEVRTLQELLQKAFNHAHNVARGLAAMDWKGDDLQPALASLAKRARAMFGVSCRCKTDGIIASLPPRAVQELYKIAQESMTNAIKHGHCKQLEFHLAAGRTGLTLTIKNDGIPFPSDVAASERMGLHIMRYRAAAIDATFDIRANGASGTIVTLKLPNQSSNASWPEPRPRKAGTVPVYAE